MWKSDPDRLVMALLLSLLCTGALLECDAIGAEQPSAAPSPANEKGEHKQILHLTRGGNARVLKVRVNGAEVGWWLLSTREAGIAIDSSAARRLHLPVVEAMWGGRRGDPDASLVLVDSLQVESLKSRACLAVATDLTAWRRYAGVDISGVLGWAFLAKQPFAIDFQSDTITLFLAGKVAAPIKPCYCGSLHMLSGVPTIPGELDGFNSGWFTIDSTDNSPLTLSPWVLASHQHQDVWNNLARFAALPPNAGVRMSRVSVRNLLGTTGSVVARWSMPSGPVTFPENPEFLTCGNVGGLLLQHTRITFDPGADRVWVEKLGHDSARTINDGLGNPASRDLNGITPLMTAAAAGRADAVADLLDRGAEVNASDSEGRTPLMRACESGSAAAVKLLLAHGARPDATEKSSGYTALMRAAVAGNLDCVAALLDANAHVDLPDLAGHTPLCWAAAGNRASVVSLLLTHGARVDRIARDGLSPVLAGAELNAPDALRLLVKDGMPAPDPMTGRSVLMEASLHDAPEAVRELIRGGAQVNARSRDGRTALMEAAGSGATDIVRLLLAAGADPRMRSADGKDAFTYAYAAGNAYDLLLLYSSIHPVIPPASQSAADHDKIVVPAQRGGPFLFLPAAIGGEKPIPMLLDTGAVGLYIDKSIAAQLGLRVIGPVAVHAFSAKDAFGTMVEVPRVEIGGIRIGPTIAVAMDLSGIARLWGLRGPIALGMPFVDSPIRINFPAATVEVYKHSMCKPLAGAVEFPLRTMNSSCLCVPGILFGTDHIPLEIDTGGVWDLLLTAPYSLLHPDQLGPRLYVHTIEGGIDSLTVATHRLSEMEALGRHANSAVASVLVSHSGITKAQSPGVIGATMLQRCSLWLDPAAGRGWATWAADDEPLPAFLRRIKTDAAADLFRTTPLMRAIGEGRGDAVAALLREGANPDDPNSFDMTPLQLALQRGDQGMTELLLEGHATANQEVLQVAAACGFSKVVDRLLKAGISPGNSADRRLPLLRAAINKDSRCVESLLAAGYDPNATDSDGWTPLMACATGGCALTAEALLKRHANVEAALPDGRRPLALAAEENNLQVAAVLLAHGAKVDAADGDGKTPLVYAAERSGSDMVQLLLRAGANPSTKTHDGATALDYAAGPKNLQNAELIYFGMHNAH